MTDSAGSGGKIKAAVVTGHHAYDVMGFHHLFRDAPEIDFYPQNMEDFVTDTGSSRGLYDAVVFYNFHLPTPGAEGGELGTKMKEALEGLVKSKQGIFVLHHAIVAFPRWQLWSDICGIQDRADVAGNVGQNVRVEIADAEHPITVGLSPWEMVDETYVMADAGEGSTVLLTTEHPTSMRTIAWTRRYEDARVFCYQSGHDGLAYSNPHFRTVFTRGIQWVAGRI